MQRHRPFRRVVHPRQRTDFLGNFVWEVKLDAVLKNKSLDDEARREGVRDVLVELTQRPLYIVFAQQTKKHQIFDFSLCECVTSRPIFVFGKMGDMTGHQLLSSVMSFYQSYIWMMVHQPYNKNTPSSLPLVVKHFEEHDLPLFKRLDDLKVWFPVSVGNDQSRSWMEYIEGQRPKSIIPTMLRNNSLNTQGQSSYGLIILNLSLLLLMCVGALLGAASIFGTPAVLITMFCVVIALIVLNEKSMI